MGCTRGCLRCLIGITSIILLFIALVCLGFGIFLMTGFSSLANAHLEPHVKNVRAVSNQFGYAAGNTNSEDLDLTPLVEPLAICLCVIGVVMLVVAVLGLLGTCCNSRLILAVYVIVLTVIIIVQLILVILFFSKALDPKIRQQVDTKLIKPYKGLSDGSASSMVTSVLMYRYECCGIDSYEDFSEAEEWKKTYTVNENNQQVTVNLKIPIACCKMTSSGDNVVDQRCAESPTDTNSNWKTGCWGEIGDELEEHRTNAIIVIVIILLVQVVLLIMAIAVTCILKDNKVMDW